MIQVRMAAKVTARGIDAVYAWADPAGRVYVSYTDEGSEVIFDGNPTELTTLFETMLGRMDGLDIPTPHAGVRDGGSNG